MHRVGRFTSSSIYKLIKSGRSKKDEFSAAGLTYIREKKMEKLVGRSFAEHAYSRAIAWGDLMEKVVWMNYFSGEFTLISNDYRFHKGFPDNWSGIPDLEAPGEIAEIKCYHLKNFSYYTECLMSQDIEALKNDFPAEYWQLVSNAIINEVDTVTAISYLPYKEELKAIIDGIENTGLLEKFEFDPWKYRWMTEEVFYNLPYLPPGGFFKNVTKFKFEVPQSDKDFLTERVEKAIVLLKE